MPRPTALAPVPAVIPAAGATPFPINLPTAMQLADARNLDIALASQRLQAAAAQLQGSQVLWVPNLIMGTDYYRHDGQIQDIIGNVFGTSKQGFMVGGAPYLVVSVSDAIFSPLAARQVVRAREAGVQAAANDTLLAVVQAYFTVQQARGQLAGSLDAVRRAEDLLRRVEKLAPGLVPGLEVTRARTGLSRQRQQVFLNRDRWRNASAELIRVLHLDPSMIVQPLEPPQLQVTLLGLDKPVDDFIPLALLSRPELAAQHALVQATLQRLKQERLRPLVPSVLLRGFSTPVTGTLGAGLFGGGTNGGMGNFSARQDWDLQFLWQLQNFGLGNRALVRQRSSENKAALIELYQVQDRVAAEVVQAYALAQTAAGRVQQAEEELKNAQESAEQNLIGLGQTRGAGNLTQLVVRPQEVVAAIDALYQAYVDYYAAIGDYNRAQFQLYRALGQPAQALLTDPRCETHAPIPTPAASPAH
jgi:outer membrane protein TolC